MSTLQQEQVPEIVADRAAMVCSARDRSDVRNLCAALRRQPALVAALASGALPPDRFALFEAEELATSEQRAQRARDRAGATRAVTVVDVDSFPVQCECGQEARAHPINTACSCGAGGGSLRPSLGRTSFRCVCSFCGRMWVSDGGMEHGGRFG